MIRSIVTIICLYVIMPARAQQFTRQQNAFQIHTATQSFQLEFCTSSMFRVSYGAPFKEPLMVNRYDWDSVDVRVKSEGAGLELSTASLRLIISAAGHLEVYSSNGQLLSSEKSADSLGVKKVLQSDEHFFGFGERMDFLDQRGKKVQMEVGRGKEKPHIVGAYNVLQANYSPVPFFMSTKGYGIFLHTTYNSTWDMGNTESDAYSFSAAQGPLEYYFIYGPQFTGILDLYTQLTGKSPLLPKFALGLHVGTYSGGTWGHEELTSAAYVIELARRFREMGIPVDILFLDSTWRQFGKNGGKGATSFEWRETFHNPKAMFDTLYNLHYNMVGLHIRPRIDNGTRFKLLDTARELHYTYPEANNPGEFINYFDTAAVSWWWNHAAMKVAAVGARFFKTDEGSAFGALANESAKTGPVGPEAQRLHNVFPIAYAKAAYEQFGAYNQLRGLNQTREGYAGIQRFPFIFAGDWPSQWQYFGPVIKAGLNIGVSGVGYWAHCMGGFEQPADPELYVRWVQFGMLSPVALLFGMDHPGYKEPWRYGKEATDIFKQYDELRYSLLPYLYSTSYHQYKTGTPIMQALVLAYQDDVNVYNITDQYLLGENIMVCPVTEKGAATRVVYLPQGEWIDYWTGKHYDGKSYLNAICPLDKVPIFIKAGSIIPKQQVVQYVGQRVIDNVILEIYPGIGSTDLYTDDGKSLQYQQGIYSITHIDQRTENGGCRIHISAPEGKYHAPTKTFTLRVHVEKAPANGKGQYDATNQVYTIEGIDATKENTILIN
ncbi:glycoside hydrolase family 31 protein [Chitinophaga sp. LS1]|uniref:glycoside hydrolase family 31 protein n=1 Tax=Chitinophaga sp. LS1 TaxID=3051176 RepID=UPI002AAB6980|nr:glycoside hydrolase family 31 protein [Chitinophaga sp. LS1]WPV64129.1 glycoside hydrolase family 31 protein [Chitinophaga sp. LS1]